MDAGGYRHNDEGFYEKTSFQMSINRARTTTTEGALWEFSSFFSFSLGEEL